MNVEYIDSFECDDCIHVNVCEYGKFVEKLAQMDADLCGMENVLKIDCTVKCMEYKEDKEN